MKRLVTYVVVASMMLSLFAPVASAAPMADEMSVMGQVQEEEASNREKTVLQDKDENLELEDYTQVDTVYEFLPPTENWTNMVAGQAPAEFSTVSYELQDNIIEVNYDVTKSIASRTQLISGSTVQKILPSRIVAQGGYVPVNILDAAAAKVGRNIEIGSILVDKDSQTAFKVVAPTSFDGLSGLDLGAVELAELMKVTTALDNTYAVTMPQLHEVLKDFSFGGQGQEGETIDLTRGNITGFAPNVEKNVIYPSDFEFLKLEEKYKDFEYLENQMLSFKFQDEELEGWMEDGSKISVTVTGGIGIGNMQLNGKYSRFDGYRIALSMAEESYLHVTMKSNIKQEIKIPIMGLGVDLGVGSVSGGVFVIVGVDGDIRLEIGAREYVKASMGVHGGTKFYIPTSVKPLYGLEELKGDGDLAMSGVINGYLKFGPEVGIDIFGFDIAGAGAYLGTGANVSSDDLLLDVELYGILDVNAKFAGKRFKLARMRPTILKRKQANTGAYIISFLEVFVDPSRVGGIIKKQDPDVDVPDKPAEGILYRVLVVPANESLDLYDPDCTEEAYVRKYPQTGYWETNVEGEFIYEDQTGDMLHNGDQVYLEIIDDKGDDDESNDERFISSPQSPTLPFEEMKVFSADYFNDYVTGQIMPIRVINWDATLDDPYEEQFETKYYDNGLVVVEHGSPEDTQKGGKATILTDEEGNFDTRINIPTGLVNNLNVLPSVNSIYKTYKINIKTNGYDVGTIQTFKPTMTMNYNRVVEEVENSYNRREEDGKIIDSISYREYIWFINPFGTRTFDNNVLNIDTWGLSSVDDPARGHSHNPNYNETFNPIYGTYLGGINPVTVSDTRSPELTMVLDENGNETGVSVMAREITAEWVWQEHKNPVKITSADHYTATTDGGAFLVTATGYGPFLFSLKDAPQGVDFEIGTGEKMMMTIPSGLEEGHYEFTIRAQEDRSGTTGFINPADMFNLAENDYYEGNDPSPPDHQVFTLTITKGAAVTEELEESETPEDTGETEEMNPPEETDPPEEAEESDPPEEVQPPEEVEPPVQESFAPEIVDESHDYEFSKFDNGKDYTVDIDAEGSTPITWSLTPTRGGDLDQGLSIDLKSGLLTISGQMEVGSYYFTIKAENEAGNDTRACSVTVNKPLQTPPVIPDEDHGYAFSRTASDKDLEVQISATGSTPIEWSLIATEGYRIPEGVTIDSDSGVLTLHGNMTKGTYYFTIKAENDAGSDTQECSLVIKSSFNFSMTGDSEVKLLSNFTTEEDRPKPSFMEEGPPEVSFIEEDMPDITSSISIVCDDERDVYTNDRFIINGAKYLRWEPSFLIQVDGARVTDYMLDYAPWCLKYHYKDAFIDANSAELISQLVKELAGQIHQDNSGLSMFAGRTIGRQDLESEFDNMIINPMDNHATYLEFGSTIEEMNDRKSGSFTVELDEYTGTTVTGEYFTALMENRDASLTFNQQGAMITFAGQDVVSASEYDSFNLQYFSKAFSQEEILEKAGSGGENFTYAFSHHGDLPGMATFAIDTDMAEGSEVNVYKFDSQNDGFILIGQDILAGEEGVVEYKNNTMSEYLITTNTLNNAIIAEVVNQDGGQNNQAGMAFPLGIVMGLAFVVALAVILTISKRKK
jgi:hypothetical protein